MVELQEAIVLGVVQGVTEWLPVSSSGHLAIMERLLDLKGQLFFNILLHVATITVITVFFRRDVLMILKSALNLDFRSGEGRLALYIAVGNIPIALVGSIFYEEISSFFSNLQVVGSSLLITGVLLYLSRFARSGRRLGYTEAFAIGLAQAAAIVPGVSRSGFTIAAGLLLGVRGEEVFRYSFLMAIPAVLGAALFDLQHLSGQDFAPTPMALGFLTALVVGYYSLRLLSRLVLHGRLHIFSYYCWALGLLILLTSM